MLYELYSIYDNTTETFNLPFHSLGEKNAIRNFTIAANTPGSLIHSCPQDFSLYHLGVYNDQTGKTENFQQPAKIINATSVIKQEATEC